MTLRTSLFFPFLLLGAALVAGCASSSSSPPLNFGDASVNNLWYQLETRRHAGDLDQALIYADKLIELHSTKAREQQASLSAYPVKDVYNYHTLNQVGLTFLVKGDMLKEKGDKDGAREAYNTLIRDFSYAQHGTVDEFFKAAEDAKERLKDL
jgi:tetratricopeptide (TPR) repeat protein